MPRHAAYVPHGVIPAVLLPFHDDLAIDEKSLGPDHPIVARDLNDLADLQQATNRLADAEPLYRRALAIYEKSFGPDHPNVAAAPFAAACAAPLKFTAGWKASRPRLIRAENASGRSPSDRALL